MWLWGDERPGGAIQLWQSYREKGDRASGRPRGSGDAHQGVVQRSGKLRVTATAQRVWAGLLAHGDQAQRAIRFPERDSPLARPTRFYALQIESGQRHLTGVPPQVVLGSLRRRWIAARAR